MSRGALILGGNPAGWQAALDLADAGIQVHLVESAPFLGQEDNSTSPGYMRNTRLLEMCKHANITVWTRTHLSRVEGEAGQFHIELRQLPRYVDLSKCTACGDCLSVCPVSVPGTDRKAIYLVRDGQPGCAVIDKIGKAPCSNTCPGGIHVQGYVALIAQGRFQEAIDLIREAIPLPGICGRICTHPCEVNCRRAEIDKAVAIRLLKRFVADWESNPTSEPPAPQPTGKRVAVVGAGPGGITVADRLARLGYRVTVFEKLPVIGGMMAVGIPTYRLPREVIAREYQQIQNRGVEVRLNTTIGTDGDYRLDDLFNMGYEAICLAIGAHKSHALRIPGEELPGVVHGIELLKMINLSQQLDDPQYKEALQRWLRRGAETRVAVLGGGNTAMDVSRSLRRLGVQDVRILYRRTRSEMPAMPDEVEDAEQEGVQFEFLVSPVRVIGDTENGVTALECLRMKLGEPDASGRRRPVPIAGSEFLIELDLVVPAIGQAPDLEQLGEGQGITITREERIHIDGVSFMTGRPGVFAVGDAVTSDKMAVIEAIGMGKKAAAAIDAYLKGQPPHEVVVDARQVPIARRELTEEERTPKPRVPVPLLPMPQRLTSYAEVELGYTVEQAMAEAQRCLVCGPCSECLACVRACQPGAIVHEQQEALVELEIGAILCVGDPDRWGLPFAEGRGFYRLPPTEPASASAVAAQIMFDLFTERRPLPAPGPAISDRERPRIGVFICQCGDAIAGVIDTETVRRRVAAWPDVAHAQILPFSCSPESAEEIWRAVAANGLNRVVLAACSCCAVDQVCYSCTYQRVRCKANLGLFPDHPFRLMGIAQKTRKNQGSVSFEFVNIREQCAWVHADDPSAATAKATALLAAAIAKARAIVRPVPEKQAVDRSALILGCGEAAFVCRGALARQGIAVQHVEEAPRHVHRGGGQYRVILRDGTWQASALVLTPQNAEEHAHLLAAFDGNAPRLQPESIGNGILTHRPGIFYCDPALDPATVGAAAAAQVAAWLGRQEMHPTLLTALVTPARCRACATCVEICEFGAPQLVGEDPQRTAWIDPAICVGCGTCVAHCPSGAITMPHLSDEQLEAMLEQVLGT